MYPLLGSLLRWDNLRVAFALSLTQSATDNNAGFNVVETLPIVGGAPVLNRVSIGIKNRGLELPGQVGCNFAGFSNYGASNGSSLGFVSSTILLSTKDVVTYPLTLTPPGISGYAITAVPRTVPLATPYDDQGLFYPLPADQNVIFNGKTVQIASPLGNGQSFVSLKASPSTTLFNADVNGTAKSLQVSPSTSLGVTMGTTNSMTQDSTPSKCLTFPASFVMQGSSNYATILVMNFETTNRGTPSQTMKVGYQVIPNIGDTSVTNMNALMTSYSPIFESTVQSFGVSMPTTLFVRWPFATTRLRIHCITAKKFQ